MERGGVVLTGRIAAIGKRALWMSLLLCALVGIAYGDVVRMKNGTIYFGKPVGVDSEGLVFDVFGDMITLDQSDVIKSENDHTALKDQTVEVVLKDGSVIKGKIVDYDEEIGFLVDIEFGTLTIPAESLKVIEDPVQRKYYNGFPVHLGITGGYYGTIGELGSDFGGSFNISLFAEFNTNLLRGLFAGIETSYFILNYKADPDLVYTIISALPYAMYRVLAFQSSTSFLKSLVPYASFGSGIALVAVRDKRTNAIRERYGEINLALSPAAGFDYFITEQILLRLKAGWMWVPQKASSFNMATVNLGGAYCF